MVKLQSVSAKADRNTCQQLEEMNKKGTMLRSQDGPMSEREDVLRLGYSQQVRVFVEPQKRVKTAMKKLLDEYSELPKDSLL